MPRKFSLQTLLSLVAVGCLISALAGNYGLPLAALGMATLAFAALLAFGSGSDWKSLAGLMLSLGALLTFLDFAYGLFLDLPTSLTGAGLLALAAYPFLVMRRDLEHILCTFAAIAWVLLLPAVDLSPVKPYRRSYTKIQEGMTVLEVLQVVDREFPENRPFTRRDADSLQFYLGHPNAPFNAELIDLSLRNDRVTRKSYVYD